MKTKLKSALVGSAMFAAVGGIVLTGGGTASAYGTATPWSPATLGSSSPNTDPNAVGGLEFFNSSGTQITGGSLTASPFAAYVVGTTTLRAGDNNSTVYAYSPTPTKSQATFPGEQLSGTTSYPVTTTPPGAPISTTALPVNTGGSADESLTTYLSDFPQDTSDAGYTNIIEIRLKSGKAGLPSPTAYDFADISVNTAAGTWTVVYTPDPSGTATTTTIDSSTPTTAFTGANVTLKADVSPTAAGGTVQFFNGTTAIGSPVTVSGGVATTTTSFATPATEQIKATYTPNALNGYTGSSTTTAYPIVVSAVPTPTVGLAVSGAYTTYQGGATLTATVTLPSGVSSIPAGSSVSFFADGSSTALTGTLTNPSAGSYVLTIPAGGTVFSGPASHSVIATFTSGNTSVLGSSSSTAQNFFTQGLVQGACAQTGSNCSDTQYIQATVPVGTLVINTPYTATSPLDLGTLLLSADSTKFVGSATFANIVVTDARSGNLPWTVSALATPLTDGGSNANSTINPENLGLTAVTSTAGTGFIGTVTTSSNPAANGVAPTDTGSLGLGGATAHTIATANHGEGTDTLQGTLTLNAPSSTEAGVFTGTIIFTVA